MQKLEGTLCYINIDTAVDCYEKDKGKEWKASIVVDEDTADAFAELYPKQPAKKVKSADFVEKYKCELPEGAGKSVYVITLRKNELLANGNPVPDKYRPRAYLQTDEGRVDITFDKLIGNGSLGAVSIEHYESKHGNIARMKNILVTELIEYERIEGEGNDGSEFGDEPVKATPKATKPAAKAAPKPKASKAVEDMDDSDVPF